MDRTASGSEALSGAVFEGWNIGAVSVKRVRLHEDGTIGADVRRHGGDSASMIRLMLDQDGEVPGGAVVTGSQSVSFLALPYLPESICIEAALRHLGVRPDLVLSLGGETFVGYCITDGSVRRMIAGNRCAAGSGEFLVQQFGRMNLDLTSGIAAARQGRRVALASRCSVHCKSDATHKLNKGECTPADIACSLIASLAAKIAALVAATGWPHGHVLLAGGLAQSAQLVDELSRLFEIGGQDAKFVALEAGIPVDYSMNDGCSAGTGSLLEEAASSDMQIPVEQLGALALSSTDPIAFGERCAAFINSEVRSALQQGVPRPDVLAGLVYAIVENYLSRVVGSRQIGRTVVLQGGVALNSAVAPAVAALTGVEVRVPPNPELMGCDGAARMVGDLVSSGTVPAWERDLGSFGGIRMEAKAPFTCAACENRCEVQRFLLGGRTLAFGGLCSKWEMVRRPRTLRHAEGRGLVALRHELMFQTFAPAAPNHPRGRIGLPLALTTYAAQASESWSTATAHQAAFEGYYRGAVGEALAGVKEPSVVLAGRPYAAYAPEVNLSVPRKIATRGFTVIPGDALSPEPLLNGRNVWHYAQNVMAAVEYAKCHSDRYVCNISCFSCGPDAIIHHRLRRELEGRPFCFLEVDSHTAHAGNETRIGAFLDIIDANRQGHARPSAAARRRVIPAHLEQDGTSTSLVTGSGRRLALDDPQVVHVSLADGPQFVSDILGGFYASLGWRAVDELEKGLIAASKGGLLTTEREVRRAAQRLAGVPLRAPLEGCPRVLLFGGVNRIFVDGPVKDFFEERGILTKTTEMSEFMCFLQAEDIVRLGFSHGYLAPADQCSMSALLSELLADRDRTAVLRALAARVRIGFIEMLDQRWRRIAAGSGLLFSPYVRFGDVEREGHKRISLNGYTEAPMTVGRYAVLLSSGAFDGYVNIGAFNCAPANTASAVIHALSLRTDIPYAVIESDGDSITSGQLRQLETIAVQCRRRREGLDDRAPA